MSRLSVIALSQAFQAFWNDLALDVGATIDLVGPAEVVTSSPETVAVIVAAGGAERDATQWLETHRVRPGLPALVVGTDPGRRTAMQLVARGASDYFALPDDLEIFRTAVAAAVSGARARGAAPPSGAGREDAFATIVGESDTIKTVLARAARLLPHRNATVLIVGETGTGKELLARALHAGGPRRDAPFVAINCSALPEHLIESELFGHERGSFTDAHAAKPGLFEVANSGTLFLDEIGDLPLGVQAKLLRALEDKEIRRVGGTKSRTVDIRIVAATNASLPARVREGTFREDLFFRLSTVMLTLPPMRERGDDVRLIAQALLTRLAREHDLAAPALTAELTPASAPTPGPATSASSRTRSSGRSCSRPRVSSRPTSCCRPRRHMRNTTDQYPSPRACMRSRLRPCRRRCSCAAAIAASPPAGSSSLRGACGACSTAVGMTPRISKKGTGWSRSAVWVSPIRPTLRDETSLGPLTIPKWFTRRF